MRELSFEKQNEFAFKASMIIEIENNLIMILTTNNSLDEEKKKTYKVQVIFNANELEKYAKALAPYQDNEKVKTFFENYDKIKTNLVNLVKEFSTKEILKEVKKFDQEVKEKSQEMELNTIIKQLTEEFGINDADLQVVNMTKKKNRVRQVISDLIINFLLSVILMFSFSGLIPWAGYKGSFVMLVFFALYYSGVEVIIHFIFLKVFKKYIFKTFGLILILPLIISTVLCIFLPIFVEIKSILLFAICTVLTYLVRKFIVSYIVEKYLIHQAKNKKKEQKNG